MNECLLTPDRAPMKNQSNELIGITFLFIFFETVSHYIVTLVVLRASYIDQVGFDLTETCMPLPLECYDYSCVPPGLAY